MKSIKLLGFLLLIFLLAACGGEGPPPEFAEEEAETAETLDETEAEEEADEEEPEPFTQPSLTVLADGEVRLGRPTLPLAFETSGKLLELSVNVGDVVAEGDVLATLDDKTLQESLITAEFRVAQSENSLTQAEADLDKLINWEPDDSSVTIAEANIASAESNLSSTQRQNAAAGNGLTSLQVNIDQAKRELASAQEQYDNAFSEGREWEVQYNDPVCEVIGGVEQCSGITYAERIKNDREGATNRVQFAQEQLRVAQANYTVEASRVSSSSTVGAEASLISAQEELARALKAPTAADIAAAELAVTQAELALEQEQFALQQTQDSLGQAQLLAPWSGTVLSVDAALGSTVGAGTPVLTLVDTELLEFHTTNLSERDLAQIEIGQLAEITLKTYPAEPFMGRVTRIDLQASGVVGDAAVFPVVIALDPDDRIVRVGMTGRVTIERE